MTVQEYVNERVEMAVNELYDKYDVKRDKDGTYYIINWANAYKCFDDFYEDCEADMVDNVFAFEEYEVDTTDDEIEEELIKNKEYLEQTYNHVMSLREPYEI